MNIVILYLFFPFHFYVWLYSIHLYEHTFYHNDPGYHHHCCLLLFLTCARVFAKLSTELLLPLMVNSSYLCMNRHYCQPYNTAADSELYEWKIYKEKIILAIIIVVAVAGVGWFFMFFPRPYFWRRWKMRYQLFNMTSTNRLEDEAHSRQNKKDKNKTHTLKKKSLATCGNNSTKW